MNDVDRRESTDYDRCYTENPRLTLTEQDCYSLPEQNARQNVLVCLEITDRQLEPLKQVSPNLTFIRKNVRTGSEVPADVWATADILYTVSALPAIPAQGWSNTIAPRLKWVQCISAGVDHLIAHPMFADGNVSLTTVSGIHAAPIAEYVFAMILAFARKIPFMIQQAQKSEWHADRFSQYMPRELRRCTLGILGYGSIGREVARIAKAFGMDVLATKRNLKHITPPSGKYVAGDVPDLNPAVADVDQLLVDRLYPPEATRSMVALCDFVVILLPLTPQTENLVNADVIGAMKKSAVLVNVGRGGVVDEDALIKALQAKEIGGAALDVFKVEPLPATSPLWKLDNVILSPHLAGNTDHYIESATEVFAENLVRYINHQELLNKADRERGY